MFDLSLIQGQMATMNGQPAELSDRVEPDSVINLVRMISNG